MDQPNYILANCDTDSISVCLSNMAAMTEDEQYEYIKQLNAQFPEKIKFAHDGYFVVFIILKAKNYIMYDGKKLKIKGSSLKDVKKEPILKEMIMELIDSLVFDKKQEEEIYKKYIRLAKNPDDIKKWAKKVTVTKSIIACKDYTEADIESKKLRRNETNVWDAIKHMHIQEGDRISLYPAILNAEVIKTPKYKKVKGVQVENGFKETINYTYGLKTVDEYNNDPDTLQLVDRVYKTLCIFDAVLDMNKFIDYTLVKNKTLLDDL